MDPDREEFVASLNGPVLAKVFNGLGTIGGEYKIKLREGATPYSLFVPRNVPLPLREDELDRMQQLEVISKVETPTEWCAGMVVHGPEKVWSSKDLCGLKTT